MTPGLQAFPSPVEIPASELSDMRARIEARRSTIARPCGDAWSMGCDMELLADVCEHWAGDFDWSATEARINEMGPIEFGGVHAFRPSPGGMPVMLLHGWPSTPLEYLPAAERLAGRGFDPIVPSLPGFAFSAYPGPDANVEALADRLSRFMVEGLGIEAFALAGGDWGALIAARMAFEAPEVTLGLYVSTPATLPAPGDLTEPPLDPAELSFAEDAQRWLRREGHHMSVQSAVPDALSVALTDSPSGLAAYLLEKYRRWGDTKGNTLARFDLESLCEWLTAQWATSSVSSAMRLYRAERLARWRLQKGDAIGVAAAVSCWPGEPLQPPRRWVERLIPDIRSWTVMEAGGHFAAYEEPELYVDDLDGFLASI